MVTAETCPPNGPDARIVLTWSNCDSTETATAPPVLIPDPMFLKVQVFSTAVHAFVVESTNRVAGEPRAATVAVGAVAPPVQATEGTVPAATKNPDGKLMVMALDVPAPGMADVVKTTTTALPAGSTLLGAAFGAL
jgi:hypothetical protein